MPLSHLSPWCVEDWSMSNCFVSFFLKKNLFFQINTNASYWKSRTKQLSKGYNAACKQPHYSQTSQWALTYRMTLPSLKEHAFRTDTVMDTQTVQEWWPLKDEEVLMFNTEKSSLRKLVFFFVCVSFMKLTRTIKGSYTVTPLCRISPARRSSRHLSSLPTVAILKKLLLRLSECVSVFECVYVYEFLRRHS